MDCNIVGDCKIFGLRGRAHGTHKGTLSAPNGFTPPNGFTLMELLIVIAIILILMLMAIPTIGVMKKHANDTSAINSLRAITQAEIQYESTYPAQGYACSLASLGGDPNSGPTGVATMAPGTRSASPVAATVARCAAS